MFNWTVSCVKSLSCWSDTTTDMLELYRQRSQQTGHEGHRTAIVNRTHILYLVLFLIRYIASLNSQIKVFGFPKQTGVL